MHRNVGTPLGTLPNVGALMGGDATFNGIAATVMDPASFIALLGLTPRDQVIVGHVQLSVAEAMDWLVEADAKGSLPFVSEDGHIGAIAAKSIAKAVPGAKPSPRHAAAFRARIERLRAEDALGQAADAETRALLALAA